MYTFSHGTSRPPGCTCKGEAGHEANCPLVQVQVSQSMHDLISRTRVCSGMVCDGAALKSLTHHLLSWSLTEGSACLPQYLYFRKCLTMH